LNQHLLLYLFGLPKNDTPVLIVLRVIFDHLCIIK
jgi:hypothetical protein